MKVIHTTSPHIFLAILVGLCLSLGSGCSELPVEEMRSEASSDADADADADLNDDDDLAVPSNISGSFLTECKAVGGAVGCTLKHKATDRYIKLSDYGYTDAKFRFYQAKNLFEDTIESLEAEGAFSFDGKSMPPEESDAVISFSFTDFDYVMKAIYGEHQLTAAEKRDWNVGSIITYDDSTYAPDYPKKFAKINRCVMGIMMESWLNHSETPSFADIDITPADLVKIPYPGDDPAVMDVPEDERMVKSTDMVIDIYTEIAPTNFEGEYTCKQDMEDYFAGRATTVFSGLEEDITNMVVDFLFNYKGEALPE
ncbi:hypothetical protein N9W79_01795 [bacterium]|nr:hypothetical protein [bacterium]